MKHGARGKERENIGEWMEREEPIPICQSRRVKKEKRGNLERRIARDPQI